MLLGIYALGLGIPFFLAALLTQQFLVLVVRFKKTLHLFEKVAGAGLVITGVLFLTGGMNQLSIYLIEVFPALTKLG